MDQWVAQARSHVECSVGRLIEVRPEMMYCVETVASIDAAIGAAVRKLKVEGLFCVDWRRLRVLSPEVADALGALMKGGNSRVLRSATLIGERATMGLQLERIFRGANNPSRRAFRNVAELLAWLGEVATPEESKRARQFLLETTGPELLSGRPTRSTELG